MIRRLGVYLFATLALLLSGCATTPPFSEKALLSVNRDLTPEQALKGAAQDVQVLWGGVIIGAENLSDHTDLNVLFFPLDKSQRPDMDKPPHNRFIARYKGYLESMVYAPGREVTILGSVQGIEDGKIGDAPYRFPVLKADKIHLWPMGQDSKVRFGVGIGIGVHM